MNEAIHVSHLSKSYGKRCVVDDLNLSITPGTVFGLLGANGAGKTTSLECILGMKKKDEGSVSLLGMDPVTDRKKVFEKVGVQFQESAYQNEITVKELCEETSSLYKEPADWQELVNRFGIAGKEKQTVKSLSGGERQRLFIILALIPSPSVVFLDELTTGLDVSARREVWNILEQLKKDGLTIVLTSHFMDEVEALCDKICILKHGKTVFSGTIAEAVANSPCEKFEDVYLWYTKEDNK